jgi:hypothetical protein
MTHTLSTHIINPIIELHDTKRYQDASHMLNIFCDEIVKKQGFIDTFIRWFVVYNPILNIPDFLFINDNVKTLFSREIYEKRKTTETTEIPEIYLKCMTMGQTDELCIILEYNVNPVEMSEKEKIPMNYSVRYTPKHGTAYHAQGDINVILEGAEKLKDILLENARKIDNGNVNNDTTPEKKEQ